MSVYVILIVDLNLKFSKKFHLIPKRQTYIGYGYQKLSFIIEYYKVNALDIPKCLWKLYVHVSLYGVSVPVMDMLNVFGS